MNIVFYNLFQNHNIHSVGRILVINNKIQIIKHIKPIFNSVFNGISLIIKTFFMTIKGIYE